ncbi:MAG: calcium-binding protein, partial [Sulfitobacter sp.]|nr:calcium-binding protein [Sulfitobacter sp.]
MLWLAGLMGLMAVGAAAYVDIGDDVLEDDEDVQQPSPPLTNVALIAGSEASDAIDGTQGDDRVSAGDGNDLVEAGTGDDEARGDSGNDTLSGQADS